jgi:hypothetical protein
MRSRLQEAQTGPCSFVNPDARMRWPCTTRQGGHPTSPVASFLVVAAQPTISLADMQSCIVKAVIHSPVDHRCSRRQIQSSPSSSIHTPVFEWMLQTVCPQDGLLTYFVAQKCTEPCHREVLEVHRCTFRYSVPRPYCGVYPASTTRGPRLCLRRRLFRVNRASLAATGRAIALKWQGLLRFMSNLRYNVERCDSRRSLYPGFPTKRSLPRISIEYKDTCAQSPIYICLSHVGLCVYNLGS